MKRKLPSHIPYTIKDWRKLKRQQLRKLYKAYDEFSIGCAYTPSYEEAKAIHELLNGMKKRLSVIEWGE
jgi:hypothetical protein